MYHVIVDNVAIQEAYTFELASYYADEIKKHFADSVIEIKLVTTL